MSQKSLETTQKIQKAITLDQIRVCYKVIHQLRPHLTEQVFIDQVQRQMTEGYHLVCLEDEGEIKSVAGYRILEFLAWGKVLYIDDLSTDSFNRGKGYGGMLLTWITEQAKIAKCDQLHLDSGPHRHDAHRLYLNHGLKLSCYHLALDLLG